LQPSFADEAIRATAENENCFHVGGEGCLQAHFIKHVASMLRKFILTALPPPGEASYIRNKDASGVPTGRLEQAEGVTA
jgi:hypothetical protein